MPLTGDQVDMELICLLIETYHRRLLMDFIRPFVCWPDKIVHRLNSILSEVVGFMYVCVHDKHVANVNYGE